MQHKTKRILETPTLEKWAELTARACESTIKSFNNMAYDDEKLTPEMVEMVLCNIKSSLIDDSFNSPSEDSHLESDYSIDNYADDGDALASAGFGTDEDYGYFGGDAY